ncbi:MAG: twin-arginine translocation signal domain-containing protein [Planctomycetaceae bacterium]
MSPAASPNRRDFLKAAASTAAVAIPYVITSRRSATPSRRRRATGS